MRDLVAADLYAHWERTLANLPAVVATPLDQLQAWLLTHARCPLAVADAVVLDPPRWRYSQATGLQACCRRGGTEANLAFDRASVRALGWWIGLLVCVVDQDRELFLDADGQLSAAYWQCAGAFDRAIRSAVLLEQAGASGVVH